LKGDGWTVVTFAEWHQGFVVARGNPKAIRKVEDLARRGVRLINREDGSGARTLLNALVRRAGIPSKSLHGWNIEASSHLAVARNVAEGRADVGISVEAAARLFGLTFIPLQAERYDLVIPTDAIHQHAGLNRFLDALSSRAFRAEIEALGGYDTQETGQVRTLRET
jgi:molybdate-binding protein